MAELTPNSGLFDRLRRIFSTDVVIRNTGGNQLSVIDTNQIQTSGKIETNSVYNRFGRLFTSTSPSSLYGAQFNINYQYLRTQLYSEYDVMDTDAIIASSLDIYADESTLKNDLGEVLQIRSSDDDTQRILYNLFYDVLNIEFNMWSWVRQMCKYGDFFLKLEIAEKFGVFNVIPYTAYHIERQEGFDRDNLSKVRFAFSPDGFAGGSYGYYNTPGAPTPTNRIYFENYEMAHFRLLADVNYLPYGRSIIEPARRLYKQYAMMEDAMLIHRIVRAPEKRTFYINVAGIPPNEIDAFMQKTISNMKRTPYVDPQTGEYNLKYNMQNMLEDFYIPIRGNDASTKIEATKGLDYDGIADVNYLRDKLFAALKVPKAFMNYDENTSGKATLAAQDIRFARTIDRIQRIILSELNKIALIHLYTLGKRGEELTNFELMMTTPSVIYDQERIALLKEKIDLAGQMVEKNLFPTDWIYDKIFHLSSDQYDEMRDLIREDSKRDFRLKQIKEEGNDPQETGKSYGTPHDLASLYGRGRYESNSDVPTGYDEEKDLGRPTEKTTNINTQHNAFGKDRLGKEAAKNDDQPGLSSKYNTKTLALENTKLEYLRNQSLLKSIPTTKSEKKLIFESDNQSSLLDDSQILDHKIPLQK